MAQVWMGCRSGRDRTHIICKDNTEYGVVFMKLVRDFSSIEMLHLVLGAVGKSDDSNLGF